MVRLSPSLFGIIVGSLGILWNIIQIVGYTVTWINLEEIQRENDDFRDYAIVCIVLAIVVIIFNIFLIIGIHKKRHRYMIPWLVFSVIAWIYCCINIFCGSILGIVLDGQFKYLTIWDAIDVIALVLSSIVIRALYRLYKDIRNGNSIQHEKKGAIVSQLQSINIIQPLSLSNKVPPPSYAEVLMLAEKSEIS